MVRFRARPALLLAVIVFILPGCARFWWSDTPEPIPMAAEPMPLDIAYIPVPESERPSTPNVQLLDFSPRMLTGWSGFGGVALETISDGAGRYAGVLRAFVPRPEFAEPDQGVRFVLPPEYAERLAGKRVRLLVRARTLLEDPIGTFSISADNTQDATAWFSFRATEELQEYSATVVLPFSTDARRRMTVGIWPDNGGTGAPLIVDYIAIEDFSHAFARPARAVALPPRQAVVPMDPVLITPAPMADAPMPALVRADSDTMASPSTSGSSPGAYAAHLASYRAMGRAQSGWRELQQRVPRALGSRMPAYYRARVAKFPTPVIRLAVDGFANRSEAQAFCGLVRQRFEYCQPMGVGATLGERQP